MPLDTVDMSNDNLHKGGHIAAERLAAFDEESPTHDELAHLAGCAPCRREHQAFGVLASLAGAAATPGAERLTDWDQLAVRLRAEGLLAPADVVPTTVSRGDHAIAVSSGSPAATVVHGRDHVRLAGRTTPLSRTWLRVAAALVFTVGGAFLGRLSAGAPLLSDATVALADPSAAPLAPATLASAGGDVTGFASVSQATDVLARAQREYERASLWLAANDTTVHSSDVYRARLAALDEMMTASRAALRDAPQDPVLNHYFLAAYTAREATLQALGGALPVDKTLERY